MIFVILVSVVETQYDNDHGTGKVFIYNNDKLNAVEKNIEISVFNFFQNYPNPFNPTTNISYSLAENGYVQLTVYDILGKEVATLVDQQQNSGLHSVVFDARSLASGVYFLRLQIGEFRISKKMVLLR